VSAVVAVVMAHQKRPAKSGVRVRKGDFSPPDANRRGEIVEEIVDHLRPWKRRMSAGTVAHDVNQWLDTLLEIVVAEAKNFARSLNRVQAKKLDRALYKVETLLASAPPALAMFLASPAAIKEHWARKRARSSATKDFAQAHRGRVDFLVSELKRLRNICARFIDPGFGYAPNFDGEKYRSAWLAHILMRRLSDKTITGTEGAAFRAIANLIYEAVSGLPDADLKRACDSELHESKTPD